MRVVSCCVDSSLNIPPRVQQVAFLLVCVSADPRPWFGGVFGRQPLREVACCSLVWLQDQVIFIPPSSNRRYVLHNGEMFVRRGRGVLCLATTSFTVFPPSAADSHWPAVCVVVPASHRCHGRDHPGSILLEAMHCACACVVDVVSYPVLTFLAPCRTETKVYTTSSVHDSGEKQLLCGARVVCCVHTAVHLCPGNTS